MIYDIRSVNSYIIYYRIRKSAWTFLSFQVLAFQRTATYEGSSLYSWSWRTKAYLKRIIQIAGQWCQNGMDKPQINFKGKNLCRHLYWMVSYIQCSTVWITKQRNLILKSYLKFDINLHTFLLEYFSVYQCLNDSIKKYPQ